MPDLLPEEQLPNPILFTQFRLVKRVKTNPDFFCIIPLQNVSYRLINDAYIIEMGINILTVAFLLVHVVALAQPVKDAMIPLKEGVKLSGYAGEKINTCISGSILAQDPKHLVEPFRHRNETRQWQTEFWGKWFTAAAGAYQYNRDPKIKAMLDEAVNGLLATQSPDGYIGNYAPGSHLQQWDIWGRKYCILGLLAYYEITKEKKVLVATRALADHLMREISVNGKDIDQLGNHRGMAASSVLEPMVKLYRFTNDKKYLQFCESIVDSWEKDNDPGLIAKAIAGVPVAKRFPVPKNWWDWEQGQKAYEMMSCYEGLLELYRVTGNSNYRKAVEAAAENILATEITITGSGSSMECWYGGHLTQTHPAVHTMETCVTVTWMKLCLQLLQTTGDVKWANEIERTFYNALLGSMTPDGSLWSKYSELSGYRHFGEDQCGMGMNCCTASGPRGMMVLPRFALMQNEKGPVLNLFTDGQYKFRSADKKEMSFSVTTKYPASPKVTIEIQSQEQTKFDFQIRIPSWSKDTRVEVNGQAQPVPPAGSYVSLQHSWEKGDRIDVVFDMRARIISSPGEKLFYAIEYGPLVLATDQRLEKQQDYEFLEPKTDTTGILPINIMSSPDKPFYFVAKVPFRTKAVFDGDTEITFCDYASAGNTWSNESAFRVWIPKLIDVSGEDK